jgi:predicted peptidase
VKRYHIDPDRIYIHGLSNGGMAAYDMIKRAPWLFAAALPMSAPTEAAVINQNLLASIASIPLWIFQGGQDTGPSPGRTHGYVAKFREAGMLVRYTEYPNLGHGVWNTAYDEPDFFSWMLQKNKTDIHLFAGASKIC